jgi:hypothetical protein
MWAKAAFSAIFPTSWGNSIAGTGKKLLLRCTRKRAQEEARGHCQEVDEHLQADESSREEK